MRSVERVEDRCKYKILFEIEERGKIINEDLK